MKNTIIQLIIKQSSVFVCRYYYEKHSELKLKICKQRNLLYYYVKMKSITIIYKQRNLIYYYVKKVITEKNSQLFTLHSHQLLLISINQKRGYIFFTYFNKTSICININLKGHF